MRTARFVLLSLLFASLVLAGISAGATAATYCVQDQACVSAGGTNQPTIASAIAAAAASSGRDRIQIGPGTFTEGALVVNAGNPVDVVGAGVGRTTIASAAADDVTTLTLDDPTATVADLTIALAPGGQETGLALTGSASDVAVTGAGVTWGKGVEFEGAGSFADGSVTLPTTNTTGVVDGVGSSAGTVVRSTVVAETGIEDVARVSGVRVTAHWGIMLRSQTASFPTSATIDDSLVQLAPGGTGISAFASGPDGGATTVVVRHVTVVGTGGWGATGIYAVAAGGGTLPASTTVTVSSTILHDLVTDLAQSATGGSDPASPTTADIAIDYSDFDPAKTSSQDSSTPGGGAASGAISAGAHNLNVDPWFADPAGDLRELSPVIDRGSPTLAADEPTVDLAGNPRLVDGDGDGQAISDMGAYEYGPSPGCPVRIPGLCCGHPGCCEACPPPYPLLLQLSLKPARFAVASPPGAGTRPHRGRRSPPRGAMLRFELSRPARMAFTIDRVTGGRRSAIGCVKPSRRLRRARRCTLVTTVFGFRRTGRAGVNALPFTGRYGRRGTWALGPGAYRLYAVVTGDNPGTRSSELSFAILKG